MKSTLTKRFQGKTAFFFFFSMSLVFLMASRAPIDSDLWWHLRAGDDFLQSGQVVTIDTYSFTRLGTAWINHSWLSQVLMAIAFRLGGFPGLGLLFLVPVMASMALAYLSMNGREGVKPAVLFLGALIAAKVWTPRPQVFSLMFLALIVFLMERRNKSVWLIPVLFLLWGNLHGGYPLGFLYLGTYIAGCILQHFAGAESMDISRKDGMRLLLSILVSALILWINVNGLGVYAIPFQTVGVDVLRDFVSEWASPDFHDISQQPFLWMIGLLFFSMVISKTKVNWRDMLIVLVFGGMGFLARRNYGPFAIAAMPILSRSLSSSIDTISSEIKSNLAINRLLGGLKEFNQQSDHSLSRWINLTLFLILLAASSIKLVWVTHPAVVQKYESDIFPVGAVDFLNAKKLDGEILNEYDWGGYLLWRLPERRVYVDGRTDLFGDEILNEWMSVIRADSGWEETLIKRGVRVVLIRPDRPLAKVLSFHGWEKVFEDRQSVVFYSP